MANNNAIVSIVEKIAAHNGPPCKKTLQKIVFLIEAKHVNLGFDYGIHFYGPYSADLDFAVRELSDDGVLSVNYTPMEHFISVNNSINIPEYSNPTVDEVIDEFSKDSPSELELIATALYVYLQSRNTDAIKPGVIKIKGTKYTDARIDAAIERLSKTGYIISK